MIELLGVSVRDPEGGGVLRRVCARLQPNRLTVVVSSRPQERRAVLETITGHRFADEGRVWVCGVPVMPDTRARVRTLTAEVMVPGEFHERRSVLWNVLVPAIARRRRVAGLLRFPRAVERQAARMALDAVGLELRAHDTAAVLDREARTRLAVAQALAQRPEVLVLSDPDVTLAPHEVTALFESIRQLTTQQRLVIVASLTHLELARRVADRLLLISEGALVFDGAPSVLEAAASRTGCTFAVEAGR